jgi:radical SAM superfamily enzyme YgiQ (UPF0313 family)
MTESVDVVFVHSNLESWVLGRRHEPLGLGILQAQLEERGLSTKLVDSYLHDMSSDETVAEVRKLNPQLVGISAVDDSLQHAFQVSQSLKQKEFLVGMGGYGPTFQSKRCLEQGKVDFVLRGEGEAVVPYLFPDLIKNGRKSLENSKSTVYLNGREIIEKPLAEVVHDLDSIPFPLRRDMQPKDYEVGGVERALISTSRGCQWGEIQGCNFCDIWKLPGKTYRRRSPENINLELKMLQDEHGISVFSDASPDFLGCNERYGNIPWIKKFFQLNSKLDDFNYYFETRADALLSALPVLNEFLDSIYAIDVGIEHFSNSVLKRFQKGTTKQINMDAIKALQVFEQKKLQNKSEEYRPVFYDFFTIDVDKETTLEEFKEHFETIKGLSIAHLWTLQKMVYHPIISSEQQREIWTDATPTAQVLDYFISNLRSIDGTLGAVTYETTDLNERGQKLIDIFDELILSMEQQEEAVP